MSVPLAKHPGDPGASMCPAAATKTGLVFIASFGLAALLAAINQFELAAMWFALTSFELLRISGRLPARRPEAANENGHGDGRHQPACAPGEASPGQACPVCGWQAGGQAPHRRQATDIQR